MSNRPTILPINATAAERAVEQVAARVEDLDTGIAKTWSPETCPADLLPWLAWALSVDYWGEDWAEDLRRSVVAASVETHRRKGTVGAVRRALAAAGLKIDIVEWWQNGGAVHTFELTALASDIAGLNVSIGPELAALVARAVDPVKPARSHYSIEIGEAFRAGLSMRSGSRTSRTDTATSVPVMPAHPFATDMPLRCGSRTRRTDRATAVLQIAPAQFATARRLRAGSRLSRTDRLTMTFTGRP